MTTSQCNPYPLSTKPGIHDDVQTSSLIHAFLHVGTYMYHIQWNLYWADTLGTFPSVHLIEVVKIAQCLLAIKIQRLLCTVIKLHVVKEAIQSSSSLPT